MGVDGLQRGPAAAEGKFEILADIATQVETAIAEARTMSYLLHPPLLDELGLKSALSWYVAGFAKRSNITVDLCASQLMGRLDNEAESTLFRVVQECLTNVHRHSGSPSASVHIQRDAGGVRLEVRDYGKGMSGPLAAGDSKYAVLGVGLQGVQERVRQLRGRMEIVSAEGKGTAVIVVLPETLSLRAEPANAQTGLRMCGSEAS